MSRKAALCVASLFVLLALPTACSDDGDSPTPGGDGDDDTPTPAANCLSRPGDLPRPPEGRLPCDLIPPGLSLE
jgi:hypothetical protein